MSKLTIEDFTAGDKVEVLFAGGGGRIDKGEIYTVVSLTDYVNIHEHDGTCSGWLPSRFKIVGSKDYDDYLAWAKATKGIGPVIFELFRLRPSYYWDEHRRGQWAAMKGNLSYSPSGAVDGNVSVSSSGIELGAGTKGELSSEYKTEIKTDLSMWPPAASRAGAMAFMAGVKKGGRWPYNWRNSGGPVRRRTYLAAAMRHLQADLDGEDLDAEMTALLGKPVTHLGAALASIAMLVDGLEFGNVIDNRPSTNWEKDQELAKKC